MTRPRSKNPKVRVIQIRVSEQVFNQFGELCFEKYDKSKSEVGSMIIKKFLEFNNGKSRG